MAVYSCYLAAFIRANESQLLAAAVFGGLAGAVLWTAQGVYFTANALAFDAARRDAADGASAPPYGARTSISAFAGIFAVIFQLVTTLAKPAAAVLLTVYRGDHAALFGTFAAVAAACTAGMLFVRPLSALSSAGYANGTRGDGQSGGGGSDGGEGGGEGGPARGRSGQLSCARRSRDCWAGALSLLRLLVEPRAALLTLYNAGFGVSTAFFPTHITLLTMRAYEADGELGPANVGWMYSVAGLSSALVAAAFALLTHSCTHGRTTAMLLGSLGFGSACAIVAVLGEGTPRQALGAMFVLYGVGVAAWQGACMGFVGETFRSETRPAAFAHLKLTSGIFTSVGFSLLPALPLRAAALLTLGVNVVGALSFVGLEMYLERLRRASGEAACAIANRGNEL